MALSNPYRTVLVTTVSMLQSFRANPGLASGATGRFAADAGVCDTTVTPAGEKGIH